MNDQAERFGVDRAPGRGGRLGGKADAGRGARRRVPGAGDPLVATLVETSVVEHLAAEMWARSST